MTQTVLLIGKPNAGKSLLFNKLTGLQQTVANFPGVTVEVKSGEADGITYRDLPGIYSLSPVTDDEKVAVEKIKAALSQEDVTCILCLLDATRFESSLGLGLQVQRLAATCRKPVVFAVNMIDELRRNNIPFDEGAFADAVGAPVFSISAKTGHGLVALKSFLKNADRAGTPSVSTTDDARTRADARTLARDFGPRAEVLLKNQNRLDSFFLSGLLGGLVFAAIMLFLFQAIFTWAAPAMDFVEETISALGALTTSAMPAGIVQDFFNDAIFGGVGSFLVFVPQIFMLTFLIGLLEDSGYLARAAIICHKPLSLFGLSGKSFVPLLSGHACAIPALFASRTMESPKRRYLTMLAIPLMACSARLPVYGLLVAAFIPATTVLGGTIGWQGLSFFGLYLFGIVTALVITGMASKTVYKTTSDAPFVIELPPYRFPSFLPLVRKSLNHSWLFITKAGTMIFTVTVAVWILGYFPHGSGHLADSWLASIGKLIEPLFAPLGLDWRYGVAVLVSFLAREVFVGTLGTMFGIEGADENIADLAAHIQADGLALSSGIALLVFYAIALQCVSTLAVMKKEYGNYRLPVIVLAFYSILAYVAALVAYGAVKFFVA